MRPFDVRVRTCVRTQPTGNEELVLRRTPLLGGDPSLVRVISGAFCFNFSGQRTCFATPEILCNKLISVVAKLTRGRNRPRHYSSSLLRIQ
jgi:hypothetical protein